MALIICPECGRQVSDKAPHCPNCGYPIANNNVLQRPAPQAPSTPAGRRPSARPSAEDTITLERRSTTTTGNTTTATYSATDDYSNDNNQNYTPAPKKKGMGCQALLLGILGFFVAIVIVMFITCPGDGDHRREVRALGEKTVKMYAARQGNILVSGMAMAFGDDLVDMIISQLLEVDNYGVVSIGRLENPKDPSKSQIVSVGAFGHVFTASPEELVEGLGSKLKGLKEEVTNEVEEETRSRVEDAIEEAKENGRKKAEKIANEIKQEAENKVQEITNEATEQANDNLFDNNSSDDENKNGRNVEKP